MEYSETEMRIAAKSLPSAGPESRVQLVFFYAKIRISSVAYQLFYLVTERSPN